MSHASVMALALLLDAAFGEPRWLWSRLPHPAVLIGRAIGFLDQRLNRESRSAAQRKALGGLTVVILCAAALGIGHLLAGFGGFVEALCAAVLLAQRSLAEHLRDVARALRLSAGEGRRMVARIVGRDTKDMDAPAVARAAIESGAENFSDGVLAPLFWGLVGGLPLMLLYKAVNTADSMIGYRTARHGDFGWAAARFDDLLNLIPARLSALMIALWHRQTGQWGEIAVEARAHRSPNAGWPEAAMARALGVALSGPRSYHGKMQDFAYVNAAGARDIGPVQIEAEIAVLWRIWAMGLAAALALAALGAAV